MFVYSLSSIHEVPFLFCFCYRFLDGNTFDDDFSLGVLDYLEYS